MPKPTSHAQGPVDLRGLLRAIAGAALASGCVAGCADDVDSPGGERPEAGDASAARPDGSLPLPREGWDPIACSGRSDEAFPVPLTGITPSKPFDYLAVHEGYGPLDDLRWAAPGALCAGASASSPCEEPPAGLLPKQLGACTAGLESPTGSAACATAAVVRVGTESTRIDTKEQLLSWLGTIDSSAKALLVAQFEGFRVSCPRQFFTSVEGSATRRTGAGYVVRTHWERLTCRGIYLDQVSVDAAGKVTAFSSEQIASSACTPGRRPYGLCESGPVETESALGGYFARAARLEGASVHAFSKLAHELAQLDAARALIDACIAALSDELRHTHAMGLLARRFGASPELPRVEPAAPRELFEIARENAVEGCVRETFAALVATYQAASARDSEVRAAMREICDDETRHAELSWQIASWIEPRLPAAQRAAIAACRQHALDELREQLAPRLNAEACALAGLPSARAAAGLLDGLSALVQAA